MPAKSKNFDDKADEKNPGNAARESKTHHADEKAGAKDDASSSTDFDNNELVNKVVSYFFDNDEFARTFERFAEDNCHVFDLDSDEMKLEYTDIYNEFVRLFEEKLEAYINSQGSTVQEFYDLVRRAYDADRQSGTVLCSEILIATADFDVFVLMMRQTKESALLAKRG